MSAWQELDQAIRDLGRILAADLRLTQIVEWLDGQLRRMPRLYQWLGR